MRCLAWCKPADNNADAFNCQGFSSDHAVCQQAKDASREELQRVSNAIEEGCPISAELPLSTKAGA